MKHPISISTSLLLFLVTVSIVSISATSHCKGNSITVTSNSPDTTLYPGDYLGDLKGFHLILEKNCNLVLYDKTTCIWESGSAQEEEPPACQAVLQPDGNFVVYSDFPSLETAIWAT